MPPTFRAFGERQRRRRAAGQVLPGGGTAGLGTGMGLPAAASVYACMSVRVRACVSMHRYTCMSMSPCIRGHA